VFGHEVGHARYGHIWLYAAFIMLSSAVLAALLLFLEQKIDGAQSEELLHFRDQLEGLKTWLALPPVVLVAAYLFVVFGALSRRCERQADVFGCKAVSCGDPTCSGHDESTVFPIGGNHLCPTGIRTFARALERVSDLNGAATPVPGSRSVRELLRTGWAWLRHWQHAPIPHRIAYLMTLIDHPECEARFQRRLFAFKCALMLALAVSLGALGQAIGWSTLLEKVTL
jgi:STE24 endopeptidase